MNDVPDTTKPGAAAETPAPAANDRRSSPPSAEGSGAVPAWRRIAVHGGLFAATVASTLYVGEALVGVYLEEIGAPPGMTGTILDGWPYAVTLMAILLAHEAGHYVAARIHGVPVSLPYFIPIPIFFGTFGAVIRTRGRVRSRNALLDIGAAGPLAGMAVAVPAMIVGLSLSQAYVKLPDAPYQLEGQSLLYVALKWIVLGHGPVLDRIAEGKDVLLHPIAWAAWVGFLVTMINLIPVGQLDGGHVSYALMGRSYARVSRLAHGLLVALGSAVCVVHGARAIGRGAGFDETVAEFATGLNWLVWAGVLWLLFRVGERRQAPFAGHETLGPGRKALGAICIVLFALLFMAVPLKAVG